MPRVHAGHSRALVLKEEQYQIQVLLHILLEQEVVVPPRQKFVNRVQGKVPVGLEGQVRYLARVQRKGRVVVAVDLHVNRGLSDARHCN